MREFGCKSCHVKSLDVILPSLQQEKMITQTNKKHGFSSFPPRNKTARKLLFQNLQSQANTDNHRQRQATWSRYPGTSTTLLCENGEITVFREKEKHTGHRLESA